jgi:hypothetical protein
MGVPIVFGSLRGVYHVIGTYFATELRLQGAAETPHLSQAVHRSIRVASLKAAAEIATELEGSKAWRDAGRIATAIGATMMAAVPGFGGPAAVAVDKLGTRFFESDLEPKFVKLCRLVAELEPEIEKINDLEEQLSAVAAVVSANASLAKQVAELLEGIQPQSQAVFGVSTDAGSQTFVNVSIENMMVLAQAHAGGVNRFHRIQTSGGDVHFNSTTGGKQEISDSVFRGGQGGAVGMDRLTVSGPIKTIDSPTGAGVAFGIGGQIAFGPGGKLVFGGAPKKQ